MTANALGEDVAVAWDTEIRAREGGGAPARPG